MTLVLQIDSSKLYFKVKMMVNCVQCERSSSPLLTPLPCTENPSRWFMLDLLVLFAPFFLPFRPASWNSPSLGVSASAGVVRSSSYLTPVFLEFFQRDLFSRYSVANFFSALPSPM